MVNFGFPMGKSRIEPLRKAFVAVLSDTSEIVIINHAIISPIGVSAVVVGLLLFDTHTAELRVNEMMFKQLGNPLL